MKISIDADKKGQPVILHEGQVVPNIFRLKRTYKKKRAIVAIPEMIAIKQEPISPTHSAKVGKRKASPISNPTCK